METIPLIKDEPTTKDNNIKVYYFGWEKEGKKRGYGTAHKSLESAIIAAKKDMEATGKTGYHIIGRAICGFAF